MVAGHVNRSGFTLIEVCIIIVIVAMVALVLIPAKTQRRAHARRIESVNDLKMVGLAFRLFATDHGDRMPMEVPKEEGEKGAWSRFLSVVQRSRFTGRSLSCPTSLGMFPR